MKTLCLLFAIAVTVPSALKAQIGTWKSFTAMNEVRDHVRAGEWYWAVTGGGLFAWQAGTQSFEVFTNAEGLLNNDLTAAGVDSKGNIWSGGATGVINVLVDGTSWNYILDISESSQTSKRVNRFVIHGDTVLICTEFGLSMFDADGFVFGDTYTKFGSLTDVRVSVADAEIFRDSIWVAISDGANANYLAVAALSNPNRLPPESWSLRTVGSLTTEPTTLEVFGDKLYAGTTSGLFYLLNDAWTPVSGLESENIVAMKASPSALLACSAGEVFSVNLQNEIGTYPPLPAEAFSVAATEEGEPVVGSSSGLLALENDWISNAPNGPASNQFMSIAVDDAGRVWAASGFNGSGKGIYRFDGVEWKNFTVEDSGLPTNDYYRVSVGCNGSVWASSWGKGVVEFPGGSDQVDTNYIFGSNVGMVGLAANPDFIVVTDVVCDPLRNEWMSVNQAGDTRILVVRQPDGLTWTTFPLETATSRVNTLFFGTPLDRFFAVDAFGNTWGGSRDAIHSGVFSLGNGATIDSTVASFLTDQDGLPSNEITTVVVDRDNDVWVGTERGIGIILDPADPEGPGGIAAYKPLNGIVINSIAVDALNQKWIGTPDGVILLSPDGIQQIESHTVVSSGGKLIDNDVQSISIDHQTGTVYFGTLVGLSSLATVAAGPKEEFDELVISPNPFLLPATSPLLIDGLVESSIIKILRIDGKLVREILSPGGRVGFWDGKDENGSDVASGVYLVVAYSSDGAKVATSKVAVVRK